MNQVPASLGKMAEQIAARGVLWTQAAGSNVSVKLVSEGQSHLWVKASGQRMRDSKALNFSTCLDLDRLNILLLDLGKDPIGKINETYIGILSDCRLAADLPKPSMETGFHASLSGKYVAHFHSIAAIAISQLHFSEPLRLKGKIINHQFFKEAVFLHYAEPGWPLATALHKYSQVSLIFLQNHGVLLQSNREDFLEDYAFAEAQLCADLGIKLEIPKAVPRDIRFLFPDFVIYFQRLRTFLEEGQGGRYSLSENAPLDMIEIWQAYSWLRANLDGLPTLETAEIEKLLSSPAEKVRLKQMGLL